MKNDVLNLIYEVFEQINDEMNSDALKKDLSAPVINELDSLGVVSLLGDIESAVDEKFSCEISLMSDDNIYEENGPLRNVEALLDFTYAKINEK